MLPKKKNKLNREEVLQKQMKAEHLRCQLNKGKMEENNEYLGHVEGGNPCILKQLKHLMPTKKKGRCHICTWKTNKNMFSTRCGKCTKYVCAVHHFDICSKCAKQ